MTGKQTGGKDIEPLKIGIAVSQTLNVSALFQTAGIYLCVWIDVVVLQWGHSSFIGFVLSFHPGFIERFCSNFQQTQAKPKTMTPTVPLSTHLEAVRSSTGTETDSTSDLLLILRRW